METQVISSKNLDLAISFLMQGIPVVFPTETVYGLGSHIFNEKGIQNIFTIKGRPSDNPLIVHVSSLEEAISLSKDLPPLFYLLAKKFWPGPLTLVVQKADHVPSFVSAGLSSIAIRMPSHPVARELIQKTGPLAAPSANISGRPSPTCVEDVLEDLNGKIPCIIDGGASFLGIESTVVSLLKEEPVLLRPGTITRQILEQAIEKTILEPQKDAPPLSPGMKYRHYAPKAKVLLRFKKTDLKGPYILSPNPTDKMRLLNEKTLYAELRRADRSGALEIEIDCCEELLLNQALMNRLIKASSS
jgi:L-threonylcarbamoyladenylate synthase